MLSIPGARAVDEEKGAMKATDVETIEEIAATASKCKEGAVARIVSVAIPVLVRRDVYPFEYGEVHVLDLRWYLLFSFSDPQGAVEKSSFLQKDNGVEVFP